MYAEASRGNSGPHHGSADLRTSAIRLQCILRAITGNLDIKGGEVFTGFNPGIRSTPRLSSTSCFQRSRKQNSLARISSRSSSRWRNGR